MATPGLHQDHHIDDKYMFIVTDRSPTKAAPAANLFPSVYVRAQTSPRPPPPGCCIRFVGVANGSEVDAKYSDFKDPGTPPKTFAPPTAGWASPTNIGMAAVVPPQGESFSGAYLGTKTQAAPTPIRPITG